ncbi:hypothetical protein FGO68_gene5422 [Halteria grandinella]|uniref:Uncharacterized protein n=1 Tax=Halteria grandinella TaxID=5974 RepID=A0A8J8T1K1_HALGN|nr:hypothetical protein FGO68_gene5422 [Halteria grandinella]
MQPQGRDDKKEKKQKKKSKKSKKDEMPEPSLLKAASSMSSLEIKLKRLDILKVAKNILGRMTVDKNVKELINMIQQTRKTFLDQGKDPTSLYQQFLPRLKGAQLEGFESVKKLNLKFNQKRQQHGLEPIDLEKAHPEELLQRAKDQEELFGILSKMQLDESLQIVRDQVQVRQMRLTNIRTTQFIIPTKEALVEKVSLSECIPFVDESIPEIRRAFMLQQQLGKAKEQLRVYFKELRILVKSPDILASDTPKPAPLQESKLKELPQSSTAINNSSARSEVSATQLEKEMYESALKEISVYNSATVGYRDLSLLIFITQSAISNLKNAKSKKITTFDDFVINPIQLLVLLQNFDADNRVGKF